MPLTREPNVIPTSIRDLTIELFDPVPGSGETQRATVQVQVVMSDGTIVVRQFKLVDHVPATTITQLIALAASLRTKAKAEILPAV